MCGNWASFRYCKVGWVLRGNVSAPFPSPPCGLPEQTYETEPCNSLPQAPLTSPHIIVPDTASIFRGPYWMNFTTKSSDIMSAVKQISLQHLQ
jgi:hypothetical protein